MRPSTLLAIGGFLLVLVAFAAIAGSRLLVLPAAAPAALEAVYGDFRGNETIVWAADPAKPQQRRSLLSVQHAAGYGISAAIAPSSAALAYLLLPGGRAAETGAELWLLDLTDASRRRLGTGFDLRSPIRWSPDSQQIVARRLIGEVGGASRFELVVTGIAPDAPSRSILSDPDGLWLAPIDWSAGGEVFYARVSRGGTDLGAVGIASGQARFIAHASDGVARDFRLSLVGDRILFSAPLAVQAGTKHGIAVAATDGSGVALLKSGPNDHFQPIWDRDGATVLFNAGDPAGGLATGVASLRSSDRSEAAVAPGRTSGFDLPLAWSPDGQYLAVRAIEGTSAYDVKSEKLSVLTRATGVWQDLPAAGSVEFVGWLVKGSK